MVEVDGDVRGEVCDFGTGEREKGVLLACSDGTVLEAKYGKGGKAIWEVRLHEQGSLFDRLDICTDEDADPYSDVAHFRHGLKWVYAALTSEWEEVS